MLAKISLLILGGSLGTLARYGLSVTVDKWTGPGFPWGTACVNLLGCFFFGLIYALIAQKPFLSDHVRLFFLVGFMGSFTTFSTYVAQSGQLMQSGSLFLSFANLAFQVVVGMGVFFLGLALGRAV